MVFRDRIDAGQQLAQWLTKYRSQHCVVMAIPRGGVVVGYVVSLALNAPLDVVVPRKLGAPEEPELAIGAVVTWGDEITLDSATTSYLGVTADYIEREVLAQTEEANRRLLLYRGTTEPPNLIGKTAVVVDDGVATGQTMLAAVRAVRHIGPAKLVVAAPIASSEAAEMIGREVDEFVSLANPSPFLAVGRWYEEFEQISDKQVVELLRRRREAPQAEAA